MDANEFDRWVVRLTATRTRRALLRLLPTLPVLGGLAALLLGESAGKDRRRRHKLRHKQRQNRRKSQRKNQHKNQRQGNQKDECARSGQLPQPGKPCCKGLSRDGSGRCIAPAPPCVPEDPTIICTGRCGDVRNTCGQFVTCTPCTCDPVCDFCQRCNEASDQCEPDPDKRGLGCGDTGQVCLDDGMCACAPGSCPDCGACLGDGTCLACANACCATECCATADAICHVTTGACCAPDDPAVTCAGKCGEVTDNCGRRINCTAECTGCCDGGTCIADGALCDACHVCRGGACQAAPDGTQCNGSDICCGESCVSGACCSRAQCTTPTAPICDSDRICVRCTAHDQCPADHLCLSDGSCRACTVSCSGSAAECGTALQNALNPGGAATVYVCPGTYRPTVQTGFAVGRTVTVIGAGQGEDDTRNTILDANQTGRVVNITGGMVEMERLRVCNGNIFDGAAGIFNNSTKLSMRTCTITNNTAEDNLGGGFNGSGDLELTDCTISHNHAFAGAGIFTSGAKLTDCTVENNDTHGIYVVDGKVTLASKSTIQSNGAAGILVQKGLLEVGGSCKIKNNRGGGIDKKTDGAVTLAAGAVVCGNTPPQCRGFNDAACQDTCPPS